MNEQDRRELEQISRYQRELRDYLATLEKRIEELTRRTGQELSSPAPEFRAVPLPGSTPASNPELLPMPERPKPKPAKPNTLPTPSVPARAVIPIPEPTTAPKPIPHPVIPETESKSFEMRIGLYWFVRVGVVLLLTGLAFMSRDFLANLGPAGKVTMLYLLSSVLLGAGYWMERSRESMRNFGNVLMAGGMAAVYFTTYAAYYQPGLKIIDDPLIAGTLLLGWSAVMIGVADRKKSQTIAMFAILLAYYTTIMNPLGGFTLFSNLVLTGAGVFFLLRNRWAGITYVSLVATYLSYGFWRYYHNSIWIFDWNMSAADFWNGTLYLLGYWTLFTVAVLWSKYENFAGPKRATFLTINNGAFFAHVTATLPLVYPGTFWQFSLLFGSVLLFLAWLCRVRLPEDRAAEGSYLVQGLALITIGMVSYFSGETLAVALAAESAILLVCGTLQKNRIMKICAYLVAPMAQLAALDQLEGYDTAGLWLAVSVGAILIFNGWWIRRERGETELVLRGKPTYFVILGLFLWLAALLKNVDEVNRAPVLAGAGLALTLSIYAIRMPEVTLLGQFFLILGQIIAIGQLDEKSVAWWNPASVIVASLVASHWWQHQKILVSAKKADTTFQIVYALAIVGVLFFWLSNQYNTPVNDPEWLMLTSVLSVALLAYGVVLRARYLALFGQFFLLVSSLVFLNQVSGSGSHMKWYVTMIPILTVFGTATLVGSFLRDPLRTEDAWDKSILSLARVYRWISMFMFICWVFDYIPTREQFWSFMLVGFLLYVWGAWQKNGTRLAISGIISSVGLLIFFFHTRELTVYWPNALACLLFLAQQQIGKRFLEGETAAKGGFNWIISGGVVALWVYVSSCVLLEFSSSALSATWAIYALAVFAAGFAVRERAYRLLGIGILACAIVRIFVIDIWAFEEFYRWLTLFITGAVLILLGFVYNRYQDKIKSWL